MDIQRILALEEFAPIREKAVSWLEVLDHGVDFAHKGSLVHTREHAARVLLFGLLVGERCGLSDEDLDLIAAASVFHDTRRRDDGYDVGHGGRAADYYKASCDRLGLSFSPTCYDVIYYHDRDDENGAFAIENSDDTQENGVLLYEIFKDADALDRFRLRSHGPDVRYIRTQAARDLLGLAERVWDEYCC